MVVVLTWIEVLLAAHVGIMRHIAALKSGRPDAHGCDAADGWTPHIEGAAGEIAFAKARNVYCPMSVNTYRSRADVGTIEVRTRARADYELLVRDDDDDSAPFVLVRGRIPRFDVVGWLYGHEAKQSQWRHAHGNREPAYFVPDAYLHSIDTLPTTVAALQALHADDIRW